VSAAQRGLGAAAAETLGVRGGFRRVALLALAYLALTGVFVAAGFPFDRLAPRIADALGAATGTQIRIQRISVELSWRGPRLLIRRADASWPSGFQLSLARAHVGPAFSLSWLRGQPALAISLESELGGLDGTARLGSSPGFRGALRGIALDKLPPDALPSGLGLAGTLDAAIDLQAAGALPEGTLKLAARDGSISLPNLPIGLPFTKLDADLRLGGAAQLTLESLALDGPLVAGTGAGSIGRAATLEGGPLALELHLQVREPALRQLLAAEGLLLTPDGAADVSIAGTVAEPLLRPTRPSVPPGAARAPRAGRP
jgi:type II secretion system protein N